MSVFLQQVGLLSYKYHAVAVPSTTRLGIKQRQNDKRSIVITHRDGGRTAADLTDIDTTIITHRLTDGRTPEIENCPIRHEICYRAEANTLQYSRNPA